MKVVRTPALRISGMREDKSDSSPGQMSEECTLVLFINSEHVAAISILALQGTRRAPPK